jgi:hypothetical protein
VDLGVVEVGARPLVEHPAGEVGGDEDLLGGAQPAHVEQHDLALAQVAHHRRADRHCRIRGDTREADDPARPPVDDLKRAQGDPPMELDIAEPWEVVDVAELEQPPETARVPSVVALELEEGLLLGTGPLVGGAEVVDGQLAQADPQRRRVRQRPGRVRAEALGGPWVAGQLRPVLPVRVDDEHAVAALGPEHAGGEHLDQVGLAHAGSGEHAHVRCQ